MKSISTTTTTSHHVEEQPSYTKRGVAVIVPVIFMIVGALVAIYAIIAIDNADSTIQHASYFEEHRKVFVAMAGVLVAVAGTYFIPANVEARARRRRARKIAKQQKAAGKAARGH